MEDFIQEHLVDIIIYSKKAEFSPVPLFRKILPSAVQNKFDDYDLRPSFEWDSKNKDRSISKCPRKHESITAFMFHSFKLSEPTPGLANNCQLAFKYILGDRDLPEEDTENAAPNPENPKRRRIADATIDNDIDIIDEATFPISDKIQEQSDFFYKQITEQLKPVANVLFCLIKSTNRIV